MSYVEKRLIKNEDLEGNITYDKLAPDTVQFDVIIPLLAKSVEVAIDSTGVKESSGHFEVTSELVKHLKHAYLEAYADDPSATDAVVRVELHNITDDAVVTYLEYSGSGGYLKSSDIADSLKGLGGKRICQRINVTTASATSGATQVFRSVILRLVLGIS